MKGVKHMFVTQDLHMHTHLSLCAEREATLESYLSQASSLGITTLGIADHLWDDKVGLHDENGSWYEFYKPQNMPHVLKAREEMKPLDARGLRVLFGAEVEYDSVRGDLALSEEAAETLDFVIVPNSHTHLVMPKALYEPHRTHAEFMLEATRNILRSPLAKYVTALAHPFEAVACPYNKELLYSLISYSEYKELFSEAKEKNIAIEINTSAYLNKTEDFIRNDPKWEFIKIAKECGCKFTFGSDCHHPDAQRTILAADIVASVLSLEKNDLLIL